MKNTRNTGQAGFTLIEVLMAMAIFTIGILGLFGMQSAVITKNLTANTITSGATWAADRIELLLGQNYTASDLQDRDGDGCAGLNDRLKVGTTSTAAEADGSATNGTTPPIYSMYWNVAKTCSLTDIPPKTNEAEDQRPKHIRVIVTVNRGLGEQEAAVFNYIKQNAKKN